MSTWDDRFSNHKVHKVLAAVQQALDSAGHDLHPKFLEGLGRLSSVVTYTKNQLNSLDPYLVTVNMLDHIHGPLAEMRAQLDRFLQTEDQGNLENANIQADDLLNQLGMLPGIKIPSDLEGLAEPLTDFRKLATGYMEELEERQNKLKADIENLAKLANEFYDRIEQQGHLAESQKGRLDNAISNFQQQFSQAQEEHRSKFAEASEKRTDEFNSFINKIELQLQNFLSGSKQKADELFSERSKKVESQIGALEEKVNNLLSNYEQEAQAGIEDLTSKRKEAATLLNLVSDIAVTGNYDNVANQEQKTADKFRGFALLFMCAIVITAFYTVWTLVHEGFDWEVALFRILTTGLLGIPAFYCARESTRHRQREERNRKFQLELAAIDPYLEKMPEQKREELKAKLTERFFGQPEPMIQSDEPVKARSLLSLLEFIIKKKMS